MLSPLTGIRQRRGLACGMPLPARKKCLRGPIVLHGVQNARLAHPSAFGAIREQHIVADSTLGGDCRRIRLKPATWR